MKKTILLILVGSLFITGCENIIGIFNSGGVAVGGEQPKAYTLYNRTPGVGTIQLQFFTLDQNQEPYRAWNFELVEMIDVNKSSHPTIAEIIPLSVGNIWIYNWEIYSDEMTLELTIIDTTIVVRDSLLDSELYYILENRRKAFQLAINRSDGYYVRTASIDAFTGNIDSLGEEYLAIKYPADVGDKFPNQDGFETEVLSVNKSVTVPAGTFETIEYVRRSTSNLIQ